jgi:outer membrane lipoprotein-sorting protein
MRKTRTLPARAALVMSVVAGLGASRATAGDPPPPTPQLPAGSLPIEDTMMKGARYFDEAIAWVARGGALGKTKDFYVQLDAKWDLDTNHDEGAQRFWFADPGRMRMELTVEKFGVNTKILDGEKAWIVGFDGVPHRVHATPGAEETLKQMKEDLLRIQDLTAFLTLDGLKGNGVQFEFLKAVQGTGVYEGKWLKLARHSPDGRKITFWIAYDVDDKGEPHATWPGVVRVEGDPAQGLKTEDWVLKDWDSARAKPRPYRYPSKIQAWTVPPDPAKEGPHKFLTAVIDDIQLNAGVDPSRFEAPVANSPTPTNTK